MSATAAKNAFRILVVGAGPAGLLFSLLMKRQLPDCDITVVEQNPAGNTYGWGVVFSGAALEFIEQRIPDVFTTLTGHLEVWDQLTIVHRDQAIGIDGSTFSGISRQKLLDVLQNCCRAENVRIDFDSRFDANDPLRAQADLVVGADGVNSQIRASSDFGTSTEEVTNHFIWYGTTRVFDSLSLIFRENEHGSFVAHTYRYSPTMSTFLVECDAATFAAAGLATMTEAESIAYCERVFATDLAGNTLQSNNSIWRRFPMITNERWYVNNEVLIGDALRTVHFSIGSGTRTAMQDALFLCDALAHSEFVVEPALKRFVELRKPGADKLMSVARASIGWYEDFADLMRLDPWSFAWSYMTRGGRVSADRLRERSPQFVSAYEAATPSTNPTK